MTTQTRLLAEISVGTKGLSVLDIGTETEVFPRNMYSYGAKWIGVDIAANQIDCAKKLSEKAAWEQEHIAYLQTMPETFNILHYVTILDVKKR